jgi:hypothetical protein
MRDCTGALPSTQGGAHSRQVIPYEGLSHYWGLEEPTVPITIATYNSSAPRLSMANIVQKKFWIRPNLHAALVQLRSPDPANEVALWVDAICMHNLKIFARIQVFLKVLEQLTPFPFKISTV